MPFNVKPAELIRAAKELELEGVIAKRNGSPSAALQILAPKHPPSHSYSHPLTRRARKGWA
jgi:hypothetical protein